MTYQFTSADRKLLNRPDLAASRFWYAAACAASSSHSVLARHALLIFGSQGAQISGCVRDHFPEAVKEVLRRLAADCRDYADTAYMSAPRVRQTTLRRLARLVATLDGSGFYGPQPL